MALINYATREINAKIVYYGPGLSGKTTNIHCVFAKVKPGNKGKLISLATQGDRTLFFDFLPVELGNIKGFKTRFHLYTVPGQVFYNSTRKMVLKGSDGVVFVADSQSMMMDENIQSLENLRTNLADMGLDLDRFPVVLQYNKRDLPGAVPVEGMNLLLNPNGLPFFEASAINGDGVLKTLTAIVKYVLHDLAETPHAHSLDFGAIEQAAGELVDAQSQFLMEGAEEEDASRVKTPDSEADIALPEYAEAAMPAASDEAQPALTAEMAAVGDSGTDMELPEAAPEFFGEYEVAAASAPDYDGEVYEAEEVIEDVSEALSPLPEDTPFYSQGPDSMDFPSLGGGALDGFPEIPAYDTFPAPPAGTLDAVLRDYPSPAYDADGNGYEPEIPDEFHPELEADLTSGLDIGPYENEAAGSELMETRPDKAPAGEPAIQRERAVLRVRKKFDLPLRLATRDGVREVVLNLNLDLGITGEGLDAVDGVEVMDPRPREAKTKGTSMHEKDPSKHPPPAPEEQGRKRAETTDPMLSISKKGKLEKMFGK